MLLAAVTLTACGGNDDSGSPARASAEDQALKFAQCMRENGIDLADPEVGADGGMVQRLGGPGSEGRIDPQRLEAAQKACRKYQPDIERDLSPEEQQEFRDRILEHTKCMREHGIDMPDPQFEGGGAVVVRGGPGARSVNPDSPAFRKADQACRDLLPQPGGGR